jgi:hypothetical protein
VQKQILKAVLIAAAAMAVSGCLLFGDERRTGPDEFGVVSRAPLSQPPDYSLRPPRNGAKRPDVAPPREQARDRLFGRDKGGRLAQGGSADDARSPGEEALLKRAGALGVNPNIRLVVDRESGRVREDESLVDRLVFWRRKESSGSAVDPRREQQRLNRKAALTAPPTDGSALLEPR